MHLHLSNPCPRTKLHYFDIPGTIETGLPGTNIPSSPTTQRLPISRSIEHAPKLAHRVRSLRVGLFVSSCHPQPIVRCVIVRWHKRRWCVRVPGRYRLMNCAHVDTTPLVIVILISVLSGGLAVGRKTTQGVAYCKWQQHTRTHGHTISKWNP